MKVLVFLAVLSAALAHPITHGSVRVIAKPALVPFTQTQSSILVHLPPHELEEGLQKSSLEIRSARGKTLGKSSVYGADEFSTDRQGRQWLHVPVDVTSLPNGPSRLTVRLTAADGTELGSSELKVVRAKPSRQGAVIVDNVHGQVVGRDGLPFFPFGSYTYGVTSEGERGVPEMEVQFGQQL